MKYGRSLKPDLLVGQWNHLGQFNQIKGDERCLLPKELWAKDEDYLWYSTGSSAFYTDLKNGRLGEGTLQARYIHGASGGKPFTLGKYESTRTRVSIAELAANGGVPMGFYTRFTNPEARAVIIQYYQFLRRHRTIFQGSQSAADTLLLFPRSAVHYGDVQSVQSFMELGDALLNRHVLFDVLPDDLATPDVQARYRAVYSVHNPTGSDTEFIRIQAPNTVRASLSRPAKGNRLHLHLVNYNRTEPAKPRSAGGGIHDEKPIAAEGIHFTLPNTTSIRRAELLSPELAEPIPLQPQADGADRNRIEVPKFLVYAIIELDFEGDPNPPHP